MAENEKLREGAVKHGGETWGVLADAASDREFRSILDTQEGFALEHVINSPQNISSYKDRCANIVAKYIAWELYKKSNLQGLKKEVSSLSKQVEGGKEKLQTILDTAQYITGATVLVEYSRAFATTADRHKENAHGQLTFYFHSLIGFLLVVILVFFVSTAELPLVKDFVADDVKGLPLNIAFFGLKIALLIFAFQITQFFRKNYGAEKHLEEVYRHRSDVLQSLHAVYSALTDSGERNKILNAGALCAYERGETGYITTKEGAGTSDELLGGVINRVFR